jgi:predicted dehydrogenase
MTTEANEASERSGAEAAIPVAVVGTAFGGRVHVPALRAAGFDVVALVGRDAGRTEARAAELGVPLGTVDLDEAIAALGPGRRAVTVATPPDSHVEPVLTALAAGAHVICEKPFAFEQSEAARMVAAAEAAGVVALAGTEFRWTPAEALTARIVRSGQIGVPALATFVQHSALLAHGLPETFNADWWLDVGRGGGIINAASFHYVDRFRVWLGDVRAVNASVQQIGSTTREGGVEDTYTAMLHFESGAVGLIEQCSAAPGRPARTCRVVGSSGSTWLDDDGVWLADAEPARLVPVPADLEVPPPPPASDDPKEVFTPIELPPYTRLAERFRDLILGRPVADDAPPTPTFHDALAVQRIVDAIRESGRTGGRLIEL